jgi:hypothetical protein
MEGNKFNSHITRMETKHPGGFDFSLKKMWPKKH